MHGHEGPVLPHTGIVLMINPARPLPRGCVCHSSNPLCVVCLSHLQHYCLYVVPLFLAVTLRAQPSLDKS